MEAVLPLRESSGRTAASALYKRVSSGDHATGWESVALGASCLVARTIRVLTGVQHCLAAEAWRVSAGPVQAH